MEKEDSNSRTDTISLSVNGTSSEDYSDTIPVNVWEEDQLDLLVTHWNHTYSPLSDSAPIDFLEPSADLMSVIRNLNKYSYLNIEELFWAMPMHQPHITELRDFLRQTAW